jgi:hypothetical protein
VDPLPPPPPSGPARGKSPSGRIERRQRRYDPKAYYSGKAPADLYLVSSSSQEPLAPIPTSSPTQTIVPSSSLALPEPVAPPPPPHSAPPALSETLDIPIPEAPEPLPSPVSSEHFTETVEDHEGDYNMSEGQGSGGSTFNLRDHLRYAEGGMPMPPDISNLTGGQGVQVMLAYATQTAAYFASRQAPAQPQAPTPRAPKVSDPEYYHGSRKDFRTFMAQCNLKFNSDPRSFEQDASKITFAASFLRGNAFDWFAAHTDPVTGAVRITRWTDFATLFAAAFDDPDRIATAERELKKLKQGTDTASAYHAKFLGIAAPLDLTERSKISTFKDGLHQEVKRLLATVITPPTDFNEFVNLTIKFDNNNRALKQDDTSHTPRTTTTNPSTGAGSSKPPATKLDPARTSIGTHPGPMDQSAAGGRRAKLTDAQKQYRRDNNLCSYCGQAGHYANNCPNKRPRPAGNSATAESTEKPETPAPALEQTPPKTGGVALYSVAAQPPPLN